MLHAFGEIKKSYYANHVLPNRKIIKWLINEEFQDCKILITIPRIISLKQYDFYGKLVLGFKIKIKKQNAKGFFFRSHSF